MNQKPKAETVTMGSEATSKFDLDFASNPLGEVSVDAQGSVSASPPQLPPAKRTTPPTNKFYGNGAISPPIPYYMQPTSQMVLAPTNWPNYPFGDFLRLPPEKTQTEIFKEDMARDVRRHTSTLLTALMVCMLIAGVMISEVARDRAIDYIRTLGAPRREHSNRTGTTGEDGEEDGTPVENFPSPKRVHSPVLARLPNYFRNLHEAVTRRWYDDFSKSERILWSRAALLNLS